MIYQVDATTGDILIKHGKFVKTKDHGHLIDRILRSNKGDFVSDPLLGCNLVQHLKSDITEEVLATILKGIRLQIEYAGYKVNEVKYENGQILIDVEDGE